MLLQHIGARNHSLLTGQAANCMTHCSDKSLCVLWGIVVKIFVSTTEFCCGNKLYNFNLIWFCTTSCGDKIQSRETWHHTVSLPRLWLFKCWKALSTKPVVVQTLDSAIQWINLHPVDKYNGIKQKDLLAKTPSMGQVLSKPIMH